MGALGAEPERAHRGLIAVVRTTWVESIFKQRWRVYRAQSSKTRASSANLGRPEGNATQKPVLSLSGNRRQNGPLVNGSSLVK
jgi:hypothetical protein